MPATLFGRLRDGDGFGQTEEVVDGPNGGLQLRTKSWAVSPDQFAAEQYGAVPVLFGHDDQAPLGAVEHLELRDCPDAC